MPIIEIDANKSESFIDKTENRWREQRNQQRESVEKSPVLGRLGVFASFSLNATTGAPAIPLSFGTSVAAGVSACSSGEKAGEIPVSRNTLGSSIYSVGYWKQTFAYAKIGTGCDDASDDYGLRF